MFKDYCESKCLTGFIGVQFIRFRELVMFILKYPKYAVHYPEFILNQIFSEINHPVSCIFRGASLSRIGHDTQSVSQSVSQACFRQIGGLGGKAGLS